MPEKQIRVGLIGAGANTKALHIAGFEKQDGVEIVAVANRTPESSQRLADAFATPKVHDHWHCWQMKTSMPSASAQGRISMQHALGSALSLDDN